MYERALKHVAVGAERQLLLTGQTQWRAFAAATSIRSSTTPKVDPEELLSKPTWSVASLLPQRTASDSQTQEVTSKQLHRLLKLSALPPPTSAAEEEKMLSTLSSQLHFVKAIQQVDTTDVEPLRSLRDETNQGEREAELGLEALGEALGREEVRGSFHRRIRRVRGVGNDGAERKHEKWDILGAAEKKVGRFFVVEGGKGK